MTTPNEPFCLPIACYVKLLSPEVRGEIKVRCEENKQIEELRNSNILSARENATCKGRQMRLFLECLNIFLDHAPGLNLERMVRELTGGSSCVSESELKSAFAKLTVG